MRRPELSISRGTDTAAGGRQLCATDRRPRRPARSYTADELKAMPIKAVGERRLIGLPARGRRTAFDATAGTVRGIARDGRRARAPGRQRRGAGRPCPGLFHARSVADESEDAPFSRMRNSKARHEAAKASTPSRWSRVASASSSIPSRLNSAITASA